MDENITRAVEVYNKLCSALDARKWKYEKKEDDLVVLLSVNGEDIPMPFILRIDPMRSLIRFTSPLMFKMPEDKRIDGAIATCMASYGLADGSFDYDMSDGEIAFRMTATFRESDISEKMLQYMISCACHTVDRYNDKFLMLSLGKIGVDAFFE